MKDTAKRAKDFCNRFGISMPLVEAPMTGASSPKLAAAVSNAGGLGMLALDLLSPQDITKEIARTRALTAKPRPSVFTA